MSILKSLALLKAQWDSRQDYIDNFIPFVAECLRLAPIGIVALTDLQNSVRERFGITIPQGALKTILKRARKHGYVEVDEREKIFKAVPAKLARLGLDELQRRVEQNFDAFVNGFCEYCRQKHQLVFSPEQAEKLFSAFLTRHSLPILEAALTGLALPELTPPTAREEFLLGSYIRELQATANERFGFLETVVKGHVLASVLLYPNIGEATKSFEGVQVFLDTALILRALGYSSEALGAPCSELLAMLGDLGAERRCFRHTLDEAEGVLASVVWHLEDPRRLREGHGDVLQHFLDCNATASDVDLLIATLPVRLRGLGIAVVDAPPHTKALGLDEEALERMLQEAVHYKNPPARVRDLNSLTAIHRHRHGGFPARLEACHAIFVTTNHPLARASSEFFRQEREKGNTGAIVPHCILDESFTTLVWLKSPTRMPELPVKQVLAECYAAVNPSNTLWKRYLEEIDKLKERGTVSADDYALLRFSTEARSLLMDRTLGEVEGFGEGTVQDVLRVATENVRADANARAAAGEDRARKAEHALEAARQQAVADRQIMQGRIAERADRIANVISMVLVAVLALGLLVGGGFLEPWSGKAAKGGWVGVALAGLAWGAAIFGLWTTFTGGSVSSVRGWLRHKVSAFVTRWLESFLA